MRVSALAALSNLARFDQLWNIPGRTSVLLSMTLSAQEKGKGRLLPQEERARISRSPSPSSASSSPSSSSYSSSESDSDRGDSSDQGSDEEVSQEYLDSLLEKARKSIASKATQNTVANNGDVLEEDVIGLDDPETELKCVCLSFPFGSALTSFKRPPSPGPRHFTTILLHVRGNT